MSKDANILNSNSTRILTILMKRKLALKDSKTKKLDSNEGEKDKELKVIEENKDSERAMKIALDVY